MSYQWGYVLVHLLANSYLGCPVNLRAANRRTLIYRDPKNAKMHQTTVNHCGSHNDNCFNVSILPHL